MHTNSRRPPGHLRCRSSLRLGYGLEAHMIFVVILALDFLVVVLVVLNSSIIRYLQ